MILSSPGADAANVHYAGHAGHYAGHDPAGHAGHFAGCAGYAPGHSSIVRIPEGAFALANGCNRRMLVQHCS